MKKLVIKGMAFIAISIAMISCQGESKTIEKEVIKEVYKPTDVQVIKAQYDLQAGLFSKNLDGISDAEANKRIANTNSLAWIAGHTVDIQYNLAILLGLAVENPYAAQFGFGKPFDPKATYPELSKLKIDYNALTPKISEALNNLTEEQLDAEAPFPIPFPEQTMRGLFAFQMHHLGYEFGQIGLYRKFLGKPAFSY